MSLESRVLPTLKEMQLTKDGLQPTKELMLEVIQFLTRSDHLKGIDTDEGAPDEPEAAAYEVTNGQSENAVQILQSLNEFDPQGEVDPTPLQRTALFYIYTSLAEQAKGESKTENAIKFFIAAYEVSGEESAGKTLLKVCEDIQNKSSDIFVSMGLVYLNSGNIVKATECYQKAYELTPDDETLKITYSNVLMNLGVAASAVSNWALAEKNLELACYVWDGNQNAKENLATVLVNHGLTLARQSDFIHGIEKLQQAVSINPNYEFAKQQLPLVAKHYGIQLVQTNQFEEGIKYLKIATKANKAIAPELEAAYILYYQNLVSQKKSEEAATLLESGLEVLAESESIKTNLVKIYVKKGTDAVSAGPEHFEDAANYLRNAFALNNAEPSVKALLADLLTELATLKAAEGKDQDLPAAKLLLLEASTVDPSSDTVRAALLAADMQGIDIYAIPFPGEGKVEAAGQNGLPYEIEDPD